IRFSAGEQSNGTASKVENCAALNAPGRPSFRCTSASSARAVPPNTVSKSACTAATSAAEKNPGISTPPSRRQASRWSTSNRSAILGGPHGGVFLHQRRPFLLRRELVVRVLRRRRHP